jgi:hypothetical protein
MIRPVPSYGRFTSPCGTLLGSHAPPVGRKHPSTCRHSERQSRAWYSIPIPHPDVPAWQTFGLRLFLPGDSC